MRWGPPLLYIWYLLCYFCFPLVECWQEKKVYCAKMCNRKESLLQLMRKWELEAKMVRNFSARMQHYVWHSGLQSLKGMTRSNVNLRTQRMGKSAFNRWSSHCTATLWRWHCSSIPLTIRSWGKFHSLFAWRQRKFCHTSIAYGERLLFVKLKRLSKTKSSRLDMFN